MRNENDGIAMKLLFIGAAVYFSMSLFTFGYSAANNIHCEERKFLKEECIVSGAGLAGILWPFYWSWIIAEKSKG